MLDIWKLQDRSLYPCDALAIWPKDQFSDSRLFWQAQAAKCSRCICWCDLVGLGSSNCRARGLAIQRPFLLELKSFDHVQCQPLTRTASWWILIRCAWIWAENHDSFMTLDFPARLEGRANRPFYKQEKKHMIA